jgi:hypothetical protein
VSLNGSNCDGKRPALDVNCDRNNQEKQTKENIKELREIKMHQGVVQPSCKPSDVAQEFGWPSSSRRGDQGDDGLTMLMQGHSRDVGDDV